MENSILSLIKEKLKSETPLIQKTRLIYNFGLIKVHVNLGLYSHCICSDISLRIVHSFCHFEALVLGTLLFILYAPFHSVQPYVIHQKFITNMLLVAKFQNPS